MAKEYEIKLNNELTLTVHDFNEATKEKLCRACKYARNYASLCALCKVDNGKMKFELSGIRKIKRVKGGD